MAVRDFKLFNATEAGQINDWLESSLMQWEKTWFIGMNPPASFRVLESLDQGEIAKDDWLTATIEQSPECWLALRLKKSLTSAITRQQAASLGDSNAVISRSPLSAQWVKDAISALMGDIADAMTNQPGPQLTFANQAPENSDSGAGTGLVYVELTIADEITLLVLGANTVKRYLQRIQNTVTERGNLDILQDGLQSQTVELKVWAGNAELMLSDLQTMTIGDVIRLDMKVDQPMVVTANNDEVLCYGHLGATQGHRALQLTTINE